MKGVDIYGIYYLHLAYYVALEHHQDDQGPDRKH